MGTAAAVPSRVTPTVADDSMDTRSRWLRRLLVVTLAVIVAVPSAAYLTAASHPTSPTPLPAAVAAPAWSASALASGPHSLFAYTETGRDAPGAVDDGLAASSTQMPIFLTFQFANSSRLATLLQALQSPHSPSYHHYLTAAQFGQQFGPSASVYTAAVDYVTSLGATHVTTYTDRVSLSFDVTPAVAQAIFGSTIDSYSAAAGSYYAPTGAPTLPTSLASVVAGVDGLSSYSSLVNQPLHTPPVLHTGGAPSAPALSAALDAYPSPVYQGGVQYEYASDFQVAYDELSLFGAEGYPTNMVAATILTAGQYEGNPITTPWGNLSTGQSVGPFDPRDVYNFYNETLPAGEPHATVTGVPLNGAPLPGPLASFDNTTAVLENTLDLEMLGSTAPGAHLYNVYGTTLSDAAADSAFAFILNPNASFAQLDNVSVISNSWGGTDTFDAGWNASLATAAARGITVLAASGDSGSNPAGDGGSQDPPGQVTFFPASMAYDAYGDVAVGGTTVTLSNTTLQLASDIVWNQTAAYDAPNPAAGSTGGISQVFPEPDWQNATSANNLINGAGRGVPDVAAVANNSLMTISFGGYEYLATNASTGAPFVHVGGTSVACPLTAGLIVEADHVLGAYNDSWMGFLDPTLYPLANEEYTVVDSLTTPTTGFFVTGFYDSLLPTLPFYDVTEGQNYAYSALFGYDLTTGWGSLDAYNFTMYYVSYFPADVPGDLSAVRAYFNLSGLVVTSPGVDYNASIQQNFFVADALGAPLYWVQNVIYISGQPGAWSMNFSGWVVYPYWGLYPSDTIYEYNYPLTGQLLSTPLNFTIQTTLLNTTVFDGQAVQFTFGIPGTSPLTLPLPGGSYILGNLWENYSWGGNLWSNNPLESGNPGSISPQFGLVGGPSGGTGYFTSPTGGSLQLELQRFGSLSWVPGGTRSYAESIDQTGESASGESWTETNASNLSSGRPATWKLGNSAGSTTQGVLEYDPVGSIETKPVTFTASGLAPNFAWGITLTTGESFRTTSGDHVLYLANGTYYWSATVPSDYSLAPDMGQFIVNGAAVQVTLDFQLVTYTVTIHALAAPVGLPWWANVTQTFDHQTSHLSLATVSDNVTFAAPNSSLVIIIAAADNWTESPHQIDLSVNGAQIVYDEAFAPPPKFPTTFVAEGLPAHTAWSLNVTGIAFTNQSTVNGTSLNLSLSNGSFSYVGHARIPGYFAATGVFGVDGAAHEVLIQFSLAVYPVQFTEAGLPAGSLWAVQIQGGPALSSNSSTLDWSAPNGTYNYTILSEPSGWTPGQLNGNFTVRGEGQQLTVNFTAVTYTVTFQMSGLPAGLVWGVTVAGGSEVTTTGASLTLAFANGSYAYTVTAPSGWSVAPGSGVFHVSGSTGTVDLVASAASATTGSTGWLGLGSLGYVILGLVVVLVVVGLLLVLTRRRPPTSGGGANSPAENVAGEAPDSGTPP